MANINVTILAGRVNALINGPPTHTAGQGIVSVDINTGLMYIQIDTPMGSNWIRMTVPSTIFAPSVQYGPAYPVIVVPGYEIGGVEYDGEEES
jgi:hypothetical protein